MEAWQITLSIIFIYCLSVVIVGFLSGRVLKKSLEDFYVLSRRAGILVTFLATAATYHSAFAFLTSVATYATTGVTWWVASSAWTTGAAVFMYLAGTRLMKLGKARGHISPADALADFYRSEALRVLVAVVMAVFVIAYIVVQAVGLGLIMDIGSGGNVPYMWGSLILMLVTTLYLVLGGLRAAYWTDVLQGVWMYVGVIIAGVMILQRLAPGGVPELMNQVRTIKPSLLTMNWDPLMMLGAIMIYAPGLMLLPHLWIKYYVAKDEKALKTSALGTAVYLSSYYIPTALVGLAAAVVNAVGMPGVLDKGFISALTAKYGSSDAVMAVMIYTFLHPVLAGFLLAGAAAAAMSTLDSFLGSTSLILVRDIYQRYVRPGKPEGEYVTVSRVLMLVWLLIGWYFAILKPGLIFDVTSIAVAGGLQLLPLALQMIIPRRKLINRNGAVAGFAVGSIAVALFTAQTGKYFGMPVTYHAAIAGLIGLVVNTVLALLISAFTKTADEEKKVFEEYMRLLYMK
ncbi:MAG: sodium:solute symporter family protein [Zestosphaera sp.]